MIFSYELTVRGYELDSYNHVNNAVYVQYMEQARWEILKETGIIKEVHSNNYLAIVTEIKVRYKKEARLFDPLIILTQVQKEGPYLVFYHKIYHKTSDELLTRGKVYMLLIDKDRIPQDIPGHFLIKLSGADNPE